MYDGLFLSMRRLILPAVFAILLAVSCVLVCYALDSKPRYVSLAPSTTEILFALGFDEEVVGVSSYCNYPPRARSKESVGDFSSPNIEKIIYLKPDYVFCTGLEQSPVIAKLRGLKLNVYVADPATIGELLSSISDIGELTGRQSRARELIAGLSARLAAVAGRAASVPAGKRPKVFIEFWHDPVMTAGRGSFIDEVVSAAGGVNIAHDTARPYSIFSCEEVLRRDPDCIIVACMGADDTAAKLAQRAGWGGIEAVKNGRVYNDIDPDILLRPGPRVADGVEELYRRLYP